jgi:3-isopropylmalate dehydrogenase
MQAKIVVLPGDGIGPEVTNAAIDVLKAAAKQNNHELTFEEHLFGGCAIDEMGVPLSDQTLDACKAADAILLGAVGGPKWDSPSASVRPEQGLLRLRKELDLFANLRPVQVFPALIDSSPLRRERVEDVDILFLRELTSGIYFGKPRERSNKNGYETALDTMFYSEEEVRRIAHLAFKTAQKRRKVVTSVDKANVLESSRLWRKIVIEVSSEYPDVVLHHQLVDSMAMRIIQAAGEFDVVVTSNMFGDILTDEASVLSGSLGLLPSASLGSGTLGLYEPIHGSAPDIAGKGLANPLGAVLSAALLLRYSLKLDRDAKRIENAVQQVLADGARTADLGSGDTLSTVEMTALLCDKVSNG